MADMYGERVKQVLDRLVEESSSGGGSSGLSEIIKSRLEECGWADEVKLECNRLIKEKGIENITKIDEIVQEITPIARARVPLDLKKELVNLLKDALMKELALADPEDNNDD